MNLDEIEEEIVKDFPDPDKFFDKYAYYVKKALNRKTQVRDVTKRMINLKINAVALQTEKFVSSRNNQYLIVCALENIGIGRLKPAGYIFVVIPREKNGKLKNDYGTVGVDDYTDGDKTCLTSIITGHYIDRVRERYPDSSKLELCDILLDVPENSKSLGYINTNVVKARNLREMEVIKLFTEENRQDLKTRALGYCSVSIYTTKKHQNIYRPIYKTFKLTLSNIQEVRFQCKNKIRSDVRKGDTTLLKF